MNVVPLPQQPEPCPGLTFDDFWLAYPRKVARLAARKAWDRLSARDQAEAALALVQWRRVWLERGELDYVPHAATWLNGERWTDELPQAYRQRHASHQTFEAPAAPWSRAEMPESFRALVAKLKGSQS